MAEQLYWVHYKLYILKQNWNDIVAIGGMWWEHNKYKYIGAEVNNFMTSRKCDLCCKILALSQKSFPATLFKCCSSGVCLSSAGWNLSSERRKAMWQKKWGHWVCGRGTLKSKHCHSCLQNPGAEEILLALPKRRLIELNPQFIYNEVLTNFPRILLKSGEHCLNKN